MRAALTLAVLAVAELVCPGVSPGQDSTAALTVRYADSRPPVRLAATVRGGALYISDAAFSAAFGVSFKWDPVLRLAVFSGRRGEAVAVVGGYSAAFGDRTANLREPFLEGRGEVLVPVSFITRELPALTGFSAGWNAESSEIVVSHVEPSVLGVTVGGRPGFARVAITTKRPLTYRVAEGKGELAVIVGGAVPDSAFQVRGGLMDPLAGREVVWKGDELVLKLALGPDARAFQTYREEYPQSIVLIVSSESRREGFELEPLAGDRKRAGRSAVIVLDPSHGGDDRGAVGKGGLCEKDVVLEICKKAAEILRARTGAEVYLTRDSDYRVPPAGRAEAANGRGADVYVSVHCDSWPGGGRSGYGAFVLSPGVCEGGYWKRETGAQVEGGAQEPGPGLRLGPWARIQARHGRESLSLAKAILREMAVLRGGGGRGVRSLPVVSLVGVDAPAVCVQCGFLDNEGDLRLLAEEEGRARVAAAIARGVEAYLGE